MQLTQAKNPKKKEAVAEAAPEKAEVEQLDLTEIMLPFMLRLPIDIITVPEDKEVGATKTRVTNMERVKHLQERMLKRGHTSWGVEPLIVVIKRKEKPTAWTEKHMRDYLESIGQRFATSANGYV